MRILIDTDEKALVTADGRRLTSTAKRHSS
jgi:hypothetical protein